MIVRAFAYGASILIIGALAALSQSSPSRQEQIESHSRRAQELLKNNQPDLAAREYDVILALDPNNVDARGNLGVVRFFQGNYAKAIPELRGALHLRPALWKTQALLGMAEKRTGDMVSARTDLEQAFPQVQDEKLRVETGMELIEIYYGANDLDKAAAG